MKTMLASLFALVAAVWGWDVFNTSFPASAHSLWIARQEALYWLQPAGPLLAILLAAGTYGAVRSLLGSIGTTRKASGEIVAVEYPAQLESLQADPASAPIADLHYCARDQATDAFVPRLQALCASLPLVHLQVHGTRQGAALEVASLGASKGSELWFCAPASLAEALRNGLRSMGTMARFHQEAFEMR